MAKDAVSTIMGRRSIRKYQPKPIPEEDIRAMVEAGRRAPSAANRQPWHFVVIRDPQIRRRTAQACSGQMWMADADLIIAAVGIPEVSEKWYKVDIVEGWRYNWQGISLEYLFVNQGAPECEVIL